MPDQEITQDDIDPNNLPQPYHKGIDIDKLVDLYSIKGNSQENCAKLLGCHRSTVRHHIRQQNLQPPWASKQFENVTAVKLKSKVGMMTDALTNDKAQKARVTELTTGIGTLLDKIANLEGKSGLIVEVVSAQDRAKEIEALDAMYEELSAK